MSATPKAEAAADENGAAGSSLSAASPIEPAAAKAPASSAPARPAASARANGSAKPSERAPEKPHWKQNEEPKKIEATASAPDEEDEAGGKAMTFWEHLDELRSRILKSLLALLVGCLVGWEVREQMLAFLVQPFRDAWAAQGLPGPATLHFAAPGAAFVSYVKLSMLGGLALASPVVFYQLWAFVAPGLYAREKRFVIPFVGMSSILFVCGGYFGWRTAFPIAFDYFLSMSGSVGEGMAIQPTVMMNEYLDFVTQMLLGFGIVFEIPLLVTFLALAGLVNYLHLIRFGRWFVLVAFAAAALLTPPDVTSQLVMALPMCVLYGLSIGLAYVFGQKPTPEQRAAYEAEKKRSRAER